MSYVSVWDRRKKITPRSHPYWKRRTRLICLDQNSKRWKSYLGVGCYLLDINTEELTDAQIRRTWSSLDLFRTWWLGMQMKHQGSYLDNWWSPLMSTLEFIKLFSLPLCMHAVCDKFLLLFLFVWSSPNLVLPGALSHPVLSLIRHSHLISHSLLPPRFLHPVHWLWGHPKLYREGRFNTGFKLGEMAMTFCLKSKLYPQPYLSEFCSEHFLSNIKTMQPCCQLNMNHGISPMKVSEGGTVAVLR